MPKLPELSAKHITIIVLTSIVCVTGIELFALSKGVDGTMFSAAIGIIGLAIGSVLGIKLWKKEK